MPLHETLRRNDQLELDLLGQWIDASGTGLVVLDDTSRVVMLNRAACKLLGVDGTQALNRPVRQLFRNMADLAAWSQWLGLPQGEAANAGVDELHLRRSAPEGTVHILLKKRAVFNHQGQCFKMLCLTDISALLETQTQLEAYHRQWQAFNAAVVISDANQPDLPIVYVNPTFERISGYPSAEVLGRNCRFLQGVETQQPALGPLREAIKHQTNGFAVLRNFRKDGSLFINELFVSPVKDANNRVMHYVGIQHMQSDDQQSLPTQAARAGAAGFV